MEKQKKLLTRIRLINWHYFENETVSIYGSTLISGENTAGKSTVLDAIQLVLTTNTRRFNTAANEKGSRDLRGYVRCKVGNVGETYLRKNVVIGNVALEFYEEKTDKYFVLGVHMTSADELSPVTTRWYMEEGRLEELSFLNGTKPSLPEEFFAGERKVRFIEQKNAARERFKRRMGNLEDRFFDIIPKSLAFKPMDNVKDFINKFVLPEERIDVGSLRVNIETLSELEELMEKSAAKLEQLGKIISRYDGIRKKDKEIAVNELLLIFAEVENLKEEIDKLTEETDKDKQYLESNEKETGKLEEEIARVDKRLIDLNVAMRQNEASKLVEGANARIEEINRNIKDADKMKEKLLEAVLGLRSLVSILARYDIRILSKEELELLTEPVEAAKKIEVTGKLQVELNSHMNRIAESHGELKARKKELDRQIEGLQNRLKELENRKLSYPVHTSELKKEIEKEFKTRGIVSPVHILSDLLEVTDSLWQNAVEGYLNTQKFYLIVEPEYYNIALEIYHKKMAKIHTAGIINTRKIELKSSADLSSLAYVVHSENSYAKAYINYLLGRVTRCQDRAELEKHKIAMTPEGFLYQGYVIRNLDKESYKNPYIGQNAYRVQIENTRTELSEKSGERKTLRAEITKLSEVLEAEKKVNIELLNTYLEAPLLLRQYEQQLGVLKTELEAARKDPTLIELMEQIETVTIEKAKLNASKTGLERENGRLKNRTEQKSSELFLKQQYFKTQHSLLEEKADLDGASMSEAKELFHSNRKSRPAKAIQERCQYRKSILLKDKDELLNGNKGLKELQEEFNHRFDQDLLRGMEGIRDYIDAKRQLETVELIRFEEQLRRVKSDCEEVFRSDFLARMRENIENARNEFKSLNKALENIYYGEDSYRFVITYDKKKESLYRMITSEKNMEGYNLWTKAFEEEYKEEMAELFAKLITKDDKGEKVIEEYTDYRSYLDYDIEIHKKSGTVQKFSAIYGEKSGSETQVPYYVAIAASFDQLYRFGNTIRIMLLDEAFDKMDDERIASMMEFFSSLDIQVILATPPAKIEVIGEKVTTILTAIRVGTRSIIEEYEL